MTTGNKCYAIGIDFGTESGRAVLVDVSDGTEVASAVHVYADGVIDERLPESGVRLGPDWALQNPMDYIEVLKHAVPAVLKESGVSSDEVIGVGIDFTACTMLPTKTDGTPLCVLPEWRDNPHAWVKLWKHHASQPQADRINQVARERGEAWLDRYGGKISSEWFFSKALQILEEAPEVYHAADRMLEAADWTVWQMTGKEVRNTCTAGYKAIWHKRDGFPSRDYFAALHPEFADIIDSKMTREYAPLGARAGGLSEQAARWMGLNPGTAVAVANVDAHVSVPAVTVTEAGRMVMVMGTSTCHMLLGEEERMVEGMCGVVEDGIIPGLYGYEAGQSCVGDHFAWFVEHLAPADAVAEAEKRGVSVHDVLTERAERLRPGESGLIALDWWNGNRSVLVDAELGGVLIGMSLATRPEEIYRTLIEATAYGTRVIIEAFENSGVPVNELVACGGLPDRNPMLMQIYADVTGREIKVGAITHTSAFGAAMHGAVAAGKEAGGYADIFEASRRMARLRDETYKPIPEHKEIYDALYAEYVHLHDYFGRGENDVLKRLRRVRAQALNR